jgi:hypothetical protein
MYLPANQSQTSRTEYFQRSAHVRTEGARLGGLPVGISFAAKKPALSEAEGWDSTIRVDHDVVQWIKKHGKGYQTRINAIRAPTWKPNPTTSAEVPLNSLSFRTGRQAR